MSDIFGKINRLKFRFLVLPVLLLKYMFNYGSITSKNYSFPKTYSDSEDITIFFKIRPMKRQGVFKNCFSVFKNLELRDGVEFFH